MMYDPATDPHQVYRFMLQGRMSYMVERIKNGAELSTVQDELQRMAWELHCYINGENPYQPDRLPTPAEK